MNPFTIAAWITGGLAVASFAGIALGRSFQRAARRGDERDARALLGIPAGHPERVTARLRRKDERTFGALTDGLIPPDVLADLLREHGGEQR